jgi:hypothetical protein
MSFGILKGLSGVAIVLLVPATAAAVDCTAKSSATAANSVVSVTLDPATAWQPRGGQVRFTLDSKGPLEGVLVAACFRMSSSSADSPGLTAALQVIEFSSSDKLSHAVYAAAVPQELERVPSSWVDRFGALLGLNSPAAGRFDNTLVVPMAELRIMADGGKLATSLDVVRDVGITSVWTARMLAVLAVLVAIAVLDHWARRSGVPGGSPVMRLISTRRGYASLSQFQIVLWSFLFGAGAVYVWVLSNSLIDIPSNALVLLGIAGAATVGSKIQSNNADARQAPISPPTPPTSPPNVVLSLATSNPTAHSVGLRWIAPGGTSVASYRVEYCRHGTADWRLASATVAGTSYRVSGLHPATHYDFQVFATNAAGSSLGVTVDIATAATGVLANVRIPMWSDLVVTPVRPGEVDVTRLQMLFFTLISAAFVGLKVFDSYAIPEIPAGFMLLMGISNGVYLTSKFATTD